jgi:hypothetical protein
MSEPRSAIWGYPATDLPHCDKCWSHKLSGLPGDTKEVVMSAGRRMLVVVVTMLSLAGVGGAVHATSADTGHVTSADRWCC